MKAHYPSPYSRQGGHKLTSLLLTILFSLPIVSCNKSHSDEENIPDIDVAPVMEDSIVVHQSFPGIVSASVMADVVARVNGRLLTCQFKSGTYVHKGQVLYTIESTAYRDAVNRAEAALATARSEYEYAKHQHAAMKKALEADAVSKMDVLQAKSNEEQALAAIREAEAALSTARLNLSYCTITAPISGYVTTVPIDPGNYINGEGAPVRLTSIYDNAVMVAKFNLSEAQYEEFVLANGGVKAPVYRHVPVSFRQTMKRDYAVDLTYEAPVVDRSTGTMVLQGILKNPDNELKDGMYFKIDLPTGVRPHALLVKDASIGSDQLGSYMYVVNDSNKVVYTPVKTGELYQDSLRVIESGLRPGDRYVTKALLNVRAGEKINPVMPGKKSVATKN